MNAKYFKDQICDELDGACDYLNKAIDFSSAHPHWSKCFVDMAHMEQGHATSLYKMFMEMYTESQGSNNYLTQLRDSIMECFSSKMRKIEDLKATYDIIENKNKEKVPVQDNDLEWDTQ